eukprot:TRINITY_DN2642_c0_g1_i2.p1 TRINITY_DN2642_c0_g1~~TRINITY_DN2642_c0_g1_i2.p1  ORF type:complete len:214 (+),score=57.53 TRINITY_DN2642_c0_g1_i2:23-643(+)
MTAEPLYSPEQIAIPEDLATILKHYTKAVVRTQPENLLQFSKEYFEELYYQKVNNISVGEKLTIQQLILLREKLGDRRLSTSTRVSRVEFLRACDGTGMLKLDIDAILQLGNFAADVDWLEFLAFGATLLSQDLVSSVKTCFEIFGSLTGERLSSIFQAIALKDKNIPQKFVFEVARHFRDKKQATVTLAEFETMFRAGTNATGSR